MDVDTGGWGTCGLTGTTKWILLFPTLVIINCAHLDEENPQEAEVKSIASVSVWKPKK